MLRIPPIPPFIRKRTTQATPSPLPPLVIASVDGASFDAVEGYVVVTLDVSEGATLNDPESANPSKWSAVYDSVTYVGTAIFYSSDVSFYVSFVREGDGSGENVLNYAANPSDISDTSGRFLAAFENFPL